MRVAALFNHWPLFSILESLIQRDWLVGLATEVGDNELIVGMQRIAQDFDLAYTALTKETLSTQLRDWIHESKPEVVLVSVFSRKIPASLLTIPRYGFFNIHYGLLPYYRGPDTVFWPIRNQDSVGGFTIHKMDADWDTGAIAYWHPVPIEPEDTHGLFTHKLAQHIPQAALQFLDNLAEKGDALPLLEQDLSRGRYWSTPCFKDLCINWSVQSASEITSLVRACNPRYGGAVTFLRGIPLHVLQASKVELKSLPMREPGEIAVASPEMGVIVCCQDRVFLRLDAVQVQEGWYTGNKLPALCGIQVGEKLAIPEIFQAAMSSKVGKSKKFTAAGLDRLNSKDVYAGVR